jgi:hypothetical protein
MAWLLEQTVGDVNAPYDEPERRGLMWDTAFELSRGLGNLAIVLLALAAFSVFVTGLAAYGWDAFMPWSSASDPGAERDMAGGFWV